MVAKGLFWANANSNIQSQMIKIYLEVYDVHFGACWLHLALLPFLSIPHEVNCKNVNEKACTLCTQYDYGAFSLKGSCFFYWYMEVRVCVDS